MLAVVVAVEHLGPEAGVGDGDLDSGLVVEPDLGREGIGPEGLEPPEPAVDGAVRLARLGRLLVRPEWRDRRGHEREQEQGKNG